MEKESLLDISRYVMEYHFKLVLKRLLEYDVIYDLLRESLHEIHKPDFKFTEEDYDKLMDKFAQQLYDKIG
jgi:hypothetical protein